MQDGATGIENLNPDAQAETVLFHGGADRIVERAELDLKRHSAVRNNVQRCFEFVGLATIANPTPIRMTVSESSIISRG